MDTVSYMLGKRAGGGTIIETDPIYSSSPASGITTEDITNWNGKSDFSGDYDDLTNKPTIPTVPTNVSAFTNDAGYLTTHQDISGKQDIIQYSTMPTASADNLGKIVQYVGTTDSTYTNGYFYKCVSDGESTPTYSWENIDVQEASGGNIPVYDIRDNSASNRFNIEAAPIGLYMLDKSTTLYLTNNASQNINAIKNENQTLLYKFSMEYISNVYCAVFVQPDVIVYQDYVSLTYTYITRKFNGEPGLKINSTYSTASNPVDTLDTAQTITAKKTFNVLPESSVTPTTANQLVNKTYVDNLVGNINTVLATLATPSNGGNA